MAQVIVEFGECSSADSGQAQVFPAKGHRAQEVNVTGTAASTTIEAETGDVAAVTNADQSIMIWVSFEGTAAVGQGHPVLPNTVREFGPLKMGDKASLINDS